MYLIVNRPRNKTKQKTNKKKKKKKKKKKPAGRAFLSYGSNSQNHVCINKSRTAWPT